MKLVLLKDVKHLGKVGDEVNIEIESQTQVIVDTVERIMAERYAVDQPNK